jgi:hypothetical protein
VSAADWWRTGYGQEFAHNIERIAASLEQISKTLKRLDKTLEVLATEGRPDDPR